MGIFSSLYKTTIKATSFAFDKIDDSVIKVKSKISSTIASTLNKTETINKVINVTNKAINYINKIADENIASIPKLDTEYIIESLTKHNNNIKQNLIDNEGKSIKIASNIIADLIIDDTTRIQTKNILTELYNNVTENDIENIQATINEYEEDKEWGIINEIPQAEEAFVIVKESLTQSSIQFTNDLDDEWAKLDDFDLYASCEF